jgi:hypothetical protein
MTVAASNDMRKMNRVATWSSTKDSAQGKESVLAGILSRPTSVEINVKSRTHLAFYYLNVVELPNYATWFGLPDLKRLHDHTLK